MANEGRPHSRSQFLLDTNCHFLLDTNGRSRRAPADPPDPESPGSSANYNLTTAPARQYSAAAIHKSQPFQSPTQAIRNHRNQ
jgi:hypothetical protein